MVAPALLALSLTAVAGCGSSSNDNPRLKDAAFLTNCKNTAKFKARLGAKLDSFCGCVQQKAIAGGLGDLHQKDSSSQAAPIGRACAQQVGAASPGGASTSGSSTTGSSTTAGASTTP